MEQLSFDVHSSDEPVILDIDEVATKIASSARAADLSASRQTATERYYEEIGGRYDPEATARYHLALARSSLQAAGATRPSER